MKTMVFICLVVVGCLVGEGLNISNPVDFGSVEYKVATFCDDYNLSQKQCDKLIDYTTTLPVDMATDTDWLESVLYDEMLK